MEITRSSFVWHRGHISRYLPSFLSEYHHLLGLLWDPIDLMLSSFNDTDRTKMFRYRILSLLACSYGAPDVIEAGHQLNQWSPSQVFCFVNDSSLWSVRSCLQAPPIFFLQNPHHISSSSQWGPALGHMPRKPRWMPPTLTTKLMSDTEDGYIIKCSRESIPKDARLIIDKHILLWEQS